MKKYSLTEAQSLVADAVRRSQKRHTFWRALEELYENGTTEGLQGLTGQLFSEFSDESLEVVNLILPRVQLMTGRLTARDPRPVATSMSGTPQSEDQERLIEAVLEYWFNRNYGVSVIRDLSQDLVVCGNAFCKISWSFDEQEVDVSAEEQDEQLAMLQEADRRAAIMEGREPTDIETLRESVSTTETVITEDEPFLAYIRPVDVFVPASARRLHEARWVAQRVVLPLSEAQERYPNSDLEGTSPGAELFLGDELRTDNGEEEVVELFEFWDKGTRTLMVFTAHADKPLFEGEWPYSHNHFPIVHLANHRARPSDLFAFGDLEQLAGLQHHFNTVWTRIIDSTYRAGRKYLAVTGTLNEEAVNALESDEDDLVVMIDAPMGEPISNLVQPLYRQPISGEILNTQSQLMGLMDQVLAFSEFDSGQSGADRMSASAVAAVTGVVEQRAMSKQIILEESASRIFTLMLLLCQEFMTTEVAVKIAGPNGNIWQQVSGADLQGEFRLRVETGSMAGETRAARRAEGTQLLTQVIPVLSNLGYNTQGLVFSALKKMGVDPSEVALTLQEQQPQLPPAAGPQPGMMSNGALMESMTGMPAPTEMQERGDIAPM